MPLAASMGRDPLFAALWKAGPAAAMCWGRFFVAGLGPAHVWMPRIVSRKKANGTSKC